MALPAVMAAIAAAGTLFDMYQGIKNQGAAEDAYEVQKKRLEQEQQNIRDAAEQQRKNQETMNAYTAGNYADAQKEGTIDMYKDYYKMIGK